jgi:hypothetical protein
MASCGCIIREEPLDGEPELGRMDEIAQLADEARDLIRNPGIGRGAIDTVLMQIFIAAGGVDR